MSGIHQVRGAIHGKNYVLVRPLVEGTSAVFEARHDRNSGTYVVRLFPAEIHSRSETSLRVQSGARLSSLLRHPGIAQVLDFNVIGEEPAFVVTEYISGRSLEDAMVEDGMFPLPLVIDLVGQIGDALRAAHAMGIIHGDLHPATIRLTKDSGGKVLAKLLGFGWGKELRASGRRSGGWTYVAPEQVMPGAHRIDERADQFSLAAVVYEMLAGCSPFSEESVEFADPEARRSRQPPPVAQMVLGLPAGLDDVLRRALSYDPQERFPRLQDFATALQRVASGTTEAAAGTPRVTWEWPAPSLEAEPVPMEILPTPAPALDNSVFAATQAATQTDGQVQEQVHWQVQVDEGAIPIETRPATPPEALTNQRSSLSDPVELMIEDEDSDGVPVAMPPSARDSMEIVLAPPRIEDNAESSTGPGEATSSSTAPAPWEMAPTAPGVPAAGGKTPLPVQAANTVPVEDDARMYTPLPAVATVASPKDESVLVEVEVAVAVAATIPLEADEQASLSLATMATAVFTKGEQVSQGAATTRAVPFDENAQTPPPLVASAGAFAENREQTPRTLASSATVLLDESAQTPLPLAASAAVPSDESQQTPLPLVASSTIPPDDAEPLAAEAAGAMAWILSERPKRPAETNGKIFIDHDATPSPLVVDDGAVGSGVGLGPSVLGDATTSPPVILAGSWNLNDPGSPVVSPLLQLAAPKPRKLTRVVFAAATLAVVIGAVSVMSGMREKIPVAEGRAQGIDSPATPPRPSAVNGPSVNGPSVAPKLETARAVKAAPVPTQIAAHPTKPMTIRAPQATAEIQSERTRPLRGHSRHGASRAGGRRDHRGR